ncbi:hypothetical protein LNV09_20520 [Paucibacter sp. B2R-40]|uniref:hypothetical protein n=1 Tax=Paucibacter sp. B2R-40 TaxID=2893554 RepID=UPI0021E3DC6F|nr:hypothetical protein [Paucibacter sp. B2R-40]MCV2356532.1 hypothetical protein [Paucibacter sp. B2R-40]
MSDDSYEPKLRVPLGLKPSLEPTFDAILRRSRRQLRLLHSGQQKLDTLTDDQYLRGARLIVVEDQYVLVAPIPGAPQADLFGYPKAVLPPSEGAARISQSSCVSRTDVPEASPKMIDLDAALDDLLGEAAGGTVAPDVASGDQGGTAACGFESEGTTLSQMQLPAAGVNTMREVEPLAPMDAKRLKVDQALNCIEASASMSAQVAEILATSSNLAGDIRDLERRTGLLSAPARYFIASRQQELIVEVDGYQVPFVVPPVRNEVASRDVVQIQVRLVPTRAESDVLRVDVLEAKGAGVLGGVTTLGVHDVRYTSLDDFRRGILLILRGAGQQVGLGVREAISTTRLQHNPALVVDPGDWLALKQLAIEALRFSVMPGGCSEGEEHDEKDAGLEGDDPSEDADGREAA